MGGRNSGNKFSSSVHEQRQTSLEQGVPIFVPGPAFPQPPEACMTSPKESRFSSAFARLESSLNKFDPTKRPAYEVEKYYLKFIEEMLEQNTDSENTSASLTCLQRWIGDVIKVDDEYRTSINAPISKIVYEKLRQKRDLDAHIEGKTVPSKSNAEPQKDQGAD